MILDCLNDLKLLAIRKSSNHWLLSVQINYGKKFNFSVSILDKVNSII